MLDAKHVVRLFSRMLHLYGHRWASVYGVATDGAGKLTPSAQQWLYDLRDLTEHQVAAALETVVRKRLEWPPGPIEFLNLAEGVPSLAEVLDRSNDYGPVCRAIRSRIDWFLLDQMSTEKRRQLAAQQFEVALVGLRRSGELDCVAAITTRQKELRY